MASPAPQPLSVSEFAHELNSMLDGSMRSLRLALEEIGRNETADRRPQDLASRLEAVQRSLARMAEHIEEALSCARRQESILEARPATLEQIIERVVESLKPLAEAGGVEVIVELGPAAGALPAGALEPVFRNGLKNAIEAATAPGLVSRTVALAARCRNGWLEAAITDTGHGVLVGQNAAGCESTKPGGHGIGLSIARRVVESCGGTIALMNVPFGQGAVLEFSVPLAALQAA